MTDEKALEICKEELRIRERFNNGTWMDDPKSKCSPKDFEDVLRFMINRLENKTSDDKVGKPLLNGRRFGECPFCHKELTPNEDANFCWNCGAKMDRE